ncbi:uncharacterized protein Tco025E_04942 [Trypanosoma conorhini]|uniref:Uncharacterized protein n=1 Tax=Trypanosoma conorhini TaxID=83891 RepID=A0A3R7NDR1_9TRYP|nr:uncharacterized protein Tco025E_04942 [Trypanosoma conorhini]RNF17089.1 hypothetical protein Tco025E_04942 [Trypanosoma conorhini]
MRRGDGVNTGLPSVAPRTPCARRLRSLEDNVAGALAEDQALLVDGILAAYEALASPGTLTRLEDRRRFALDAAADTRGRDEAHCCSSGRGASPGPHALQRLSEVNVAIAWCEGKMAVTARLFPPGVPLASEPASSSWREAQETGHDDASQEYYENRDGNVESRSRSHAWPSEARLSTSPWYAAPRGVPEGVYALPPPLPPSPPTPPAPAPAPAAATATAATTTVPVAPFSLVSVARGSQGDGVVCNLGFDRWTARQVAVQAGFAKRRLWLLRCDAEEAVRRHAIAVEERVGRVTLLVTAREEVAAVVDAEPRAWTLEPPMPAAWELREARRWMQRRLDAQGGLLASAVSAVRAGAREYEAACQARLREAAAHRWETEEKSARSPSSGAKQARTPPCEGGAAAVRWARFTQGVLQEAEQSQRAHLEREAHLSRKLLLTQRQTLLNHLSTRCLLAAKESLIHEMAVELNGADGDATAAESEPPPRQSRTPSGVHRTWAEEAAHRPPAHLPAKPPLLGTTTRNGASLCSGVSATAPSSSEEERSGSTVARLERATEPAAALAADVAPPPAPPPPPRTPVSRNSSANDMALYICVSVELVKRKQVAMLEQRAWEELAAGLDKQWGRTERTL